MKLFLIRIIEYIISFVLCLFLFFNFDVDGIILHPYLKWIPMTLMIINIILIAIEFRKSKPLFRLVFSIIFLFNCIIIGITSIELLNLFVCIYGLFYLIFICVSVVKTNIDFVKENKNKKELAIGIYSRKQLVKNNISIFVTSIVLTLFGIYLWYFSILKIWAIIVLAILFLFITIIIFSIKNDPVIKLLNNANRFGKLNELLEGINDLKKNNIHSETLNYLNIIEANYTIPKDKDKALEIFDKVFEPSKKQYKINYYVVQIIMNINNEEFDEAIENINKLKIRFPKLKNAKQYDNLIKAYTHPEEINPLELFKLDVDLLFSKLVNIYSLMNYYKRINDIENAKKYAKLVLAECKEMDYYQQQARIILGDDDENKNISL
ncbi:MAG: hypothetical protein ACI35S_04760 [Anaeroplasma sp.]